MMVLRVHGDDLMFGGGGGGGGGVITHSPRIPQMEMMKVHIPFTFKLHESFKSTYAGKFSPSHVSSASPSLSLDWVNPWLIYSKRMLLACVSQDISLHLVADLIVGL